MIVIIWWLRNVFILPKWGVTFAWDKGYHFNLGVWEIKGGAFWSFSAWVMRGLGFKVRGQLPPSLTLSYSLFLSKQESQHPFSKLELLHHCWAEFLKLWSVQPVEESLGVLEQPLGAYFRARYRNLLNFLVFLCMGLRSYEFIGFGWFNLWFDGF